MIFGLLNDPADRLISMRTAPLSCWDERSQPLERYGWFGGWTAAA
jgi:hypothetical protein